MQTVPPDPPPDAKPLSRNFKIFLLAPAGLSVISATIFSLFPAGTDIFVFTGLATAAVAIVSSIYCGRSLAKRFAKDQSNCAGLTLLFAAGLLIMNGIIGVAGCALPSAFK